MEDTNKLKSSVWIIIMAASFALIMTIGARIIFGRETFYFIVSILTVLAALIHSLAFIRTKNPSFLIAVFFYGFIFMGLQIFMIPERPETLLFVIGMAILGGVLIYIMATRRMKWRYREVLELAARPVSDSADGFTPRPYPAGEASYTNAELMTFTKFLLKHGVAFPKNQEGRTVLVINESLFRHFLFRNKDYQKDTYVAFDSDGHISVNITEKDYKKYKEELTFDQLCQSLGNLFKEFLLLHQRGEDKIIIERLNALKFIL
ncbi:hypothetical protein ACFLT2_08355 [Acidobacteriota bacterium]